MPLASAVNIPDVPQFFGPNRDGIVTGAHLARDWISSPPKQLWRQPIGAGWSAFAVVGGRAYTQEQRGENEVVTCYDVLTGRLLWSHANAAHFFQWQGGGGPRATPTVDGGRVFALGATGILDCLDAATGQRIWSHDVLSEMNLRTPEWGVSASPLVLEDTVVITIGAVLSYRLATGELLWRNGNDKASYSSPALTTLAGRRVVFAWNARSLTAHDPKTGEMLLEHPWSEPRIPKAAQPVVISGDRVFLSAGYGAGCVLLQIKADMHDLLGATPLWKNLMMKNQFNSVAVHDGFLYGLDDGLLACVEIATGERKWKGGRYGSGQTLLVDDLVLVQMESGPVALAEARPDEFRELGRLAALDGKTWNHPTLAGRYLLVRNDQEAVCYELPVVRE
jgi:outer membrane protein assembly factor BamB